MEQNGLEDMAGDVGVERSIELEAPAGVVWRHLTDGELVGAWMGGEVTIDPRRGGAVRMTRDDGTSVWGVVEDLVDERRIQWSWRTDESLPTLVVMELDPSGSGTRLTVRETLLPWRSSMHRPLWMPGAGFEARLSLAA